jgi:ABC-type phosphate transport system auxiliary subunit
MFGSNRKTVVTVSDGTKMYLDAILVKLDKIAVNQEKLLKHWEPEPEQVEQEPMTSPSFIVENVKTVRISEGEKEAWGTELHSYIPSPPAPEPVPKTVLDIKRSQMTFTLGEGILRALGRQSNSLDGLCKRFKLYTRAEIVEALYLLVKKRKVQSGTRMTTVSGIRERRVMYWAKK